MDEDDQPAPPVGLCATVGHDLLLHAGDIDEDGRVTALLVCERCGEVVAGESGKW